MVEEPCTTRALASIDTNKEDEHLLALNDHLKKGTKKPTSTKASGLNCF